MTKKLGIARILANTLVYGIMIAFIVIIGFFCMKT